MKVRAARQWPVRILSISDLLILFYNDRCRYSQYSCKTTFEPRTRDVIHKHEKVCTLSCLQDVDGVWQQIRRFQEKYNIWPTIYTTLLQSIPSFQLIQKCNPQCSIDFHHPLVFPAEFCFDRASSIPDFGDIFEMVISPLSPKEEKVI